MGLFLHEITAISTPKRPRVSATAVWSLVLAFTGFLNVVGFLAGIVLGVVALVRLGFASDRGEMIRGRRLAITAIWLSLIALVVGIGAILALLLVAYAQLPSPPTHFHF